MNELLLLHALLSQRAAEEAAETRYCQERNMRYAAQYASGKSAAYTHAANLLRTYIEAEMPFEIKIAKESDHD